MRYPTILSVIIGAIAFCPAAPAVAFGPTPVALSGTLSPAGNTYKSFATPVLNDAGQVAFYAALNASPSSGIFAGSIGSLQTVALRNGAAPGGGTYTAFSAPYAMNSSGQVLFNATVNNVDNIFTGVPGSIQLVARQGAAAPGGGTYSQLNGSIRGPVLNDAGEIAFYAEVKSANSTNQSIFAGLAGAIQPAVKIGIPAPIGGTFSYLKSPAFTGANQLLFSAAITNGGSNASGFFLGSPGSFQPVVLNGATSPAGGNYSSISEIPVVNSSGQVAFISYLSGGSFLNGIFAGGAGSIQTVALKGEPAPSGGIYSSFFTPQINNSGVILFRAQTQGETSLMGLFEGAPGAVETVALRGDSAPGGAFFSDFTIHNAINSSGQLAFVASLCGPGVDTTNDVGIYAGTPGSLVKIVREGDIIDVDPSAGADNRTVQNIGQFDLHGDFLDIGERINLNDAGQLLYKLTFTDGSSGIFTSTITTVPLPGDFNHDGTVNTADYIVWRHAAGPLADYYLWRAHFGESIAGSGAALGENITVPEPSSLALLLLTSIAAIPARRRCAASRK